jgi:hypothetical protein
MLYKPTTRESIAERFLRSIIFAFAALRRQHADTRYLEGLRPSELEELGLRRTDERDFRTFL